MIRIDALWLCTQPQDMRAGANRLLMVVVWSRARRVVVLRRRIRQNVALETKNARGQLLLAAIGRATQSGGQTTLYLTPMHAQAGLIKSMIANVQAAIAHVPATAEQLPGLDRWRALLDGICRRLVGPAALPIPPPALAG
jgi:hypothetical protein